MPTVPLSSLWLPIVLSAVLVFLASWLLHMLLPYHRSDYARVPDEDKMQDALRSFSLAPNDYMLPCPGSPAGMRSPDFQARMKKGPVVSFTVMPSGSMNMGPQLLQWFVYTLVVSVFAAYVTSRSVMPGASYLEVSRIASCSAFMAYGLGLWQDSIWYRRKWSTTIKYNVDALIFGFLTGGALGWLWPK